MPSSNPSHQVTPDRSSIAASENSPFVSGEAQRLLQVPARPRFDSLGPQHLPFDGEQVPVEFVRDVLHSLCQSHSCCQGALICGHADESVVAAEELLLAVRGQRYLPTTLAASGSEKFSLRLISRYRLMSSSSASPIQTRSRRSLRTGSSGLRRDPGCLRPCSSRPMTIFASSKRLRPLSYYRRFPSESRTGQHGLLCTTSYTLARPRDCSKCPDFVVAARSRTVRTRRGSRTRRSARCSAYAGCGSMRLPSVLETKNVGCDRGGVGSLTEEATSRRGWTGIKIRATRPNQYKLDQGKAA